MATIIVLLFVHLKPAETETATWKQKLVSLDLVGFVLVAASVTMLLFATQWGGSTYAWSSSVVIGLFVGAGVVFALFVPWQIHRGDEALIPPRLFTINRNPALLCAASFFINGPFQVVIYWLPIWFQGVLGVSPTQSGINFFPTVVADVLAAFIGSAIVMQVGWWNPFLLFAQVMTCIGGGLLSTMNPETSTAKWIGYQIFGGIGYSLASNLVSQEANVIPVEEIKLTRSLHIVTSRNAIIIAWQTCAHWLFHVACCHIDELRYIHGSWPGFIRKSAPSQPRRCCFFRPR